MTKDILEIREILVNILKEHIGILKITANADEKFEVSGTVETMQGRKKVDGIYFASIVPKPKDVRLYFFPVYTHKEQLGDLPEKLNKFLKGKSCFHIKYLDEDLIKNITDMVKKSIDLYKKDKWI